MGDYFDPTDYGGAQGDQLDPDFGDGIEDEAEGGVREQPQLRDAVLFVVDCAFPGALAPLEAGGCSVVSEALLAAVSVLKTKVITSADDKVGVVIYGVREKQNPNGFEGIRVIQELDRPSAHRIKALELEAARPAAAFEERYGLNRHVPLSDVFWTCTTIFNLSANPKHYQPRVFLFTGNDSPCDTPAEQEAAETRAQDLLDLGVDIEFFPLTPPDRAFSMERFWGRVIPVEADDYAARAAMRIEELGRRVRMRVHRKRVLHRLTLEVCPGAEVGVYVFVTVLEAHVPAPVPLLNENNKPLKSETRHICKQTGGILHPLDDVETFVELCGKRVHMSRQEAGEVKRFCEPGMQLLGFKPAEQLRLHHRIFHSYFVYPNDRAVAGSSLFCAALISCMLARKLMAIARYAPRRNSMPVLVALLPQAESEDMAASEQLRPPGFHMVILPWGEEIREVEVPKPQGVAPLPEGLRDAARRVVNSMRIDAFTPGCVENPMLQKHYAAIQALALGEDKPEDTADVLQPDAASLAEKAPLLKAWREMVDSTAPAKGTACAAAKRGLPLGPDSEEPGKRPRKEAPLATPTTVEAMREMCQNGEVDRLNLPQLRDWLKSQGVTTSGKKADLVDRVRAIA